jgi:hypothetical protein
MKLLELTQGHEGGFLATYVYEFNQMLIVASLKEEYVRKLIFLHGLKSWVQKVIYQKMDIPKTCQGLMKMVECMEEKCLLCPKGEIKGPSHIRKLTLTIEAKATTSGAMGSQGLKAIKS